MAEKSPAATASRIFLSQIFLSNGLIGLCPSPNQGVRPRTGRRPRTQTGGSAPVPHGEPHGFAFGMTAKTETNLR